MIQHFIREDILSLFVLALTTFFITIGPVNAMILFMGMVGQYSPEERKRMAIKSCLVGLVILLTLLFLGPALLGFMGISFNAIKISGGVLMLLVGIETVFNRNSETEEIEELQEELEDEQAERKARGKKKKKLPDISIFPMAIPMIAGPGAISSSLSLMGSAHENFQAQIAIALAMTISVLTAMLLMLASGKLHRFINTGVRDALARVLGLIIASLAIQFIIDGVFTISYIQALMGS